MPSGENKGKKGSPGWQKTDKSKSAGKNPPVVAGEPEGTKVRTTLVDSGGVKHEYDMMVRAVKFPADTRIREEFLASMSAEEKAFFNSEAYESLLDEVDSYGYDLVEAQRAKSATQYRTWCRNNNIGAEDYYLAYNIGVDKILQKAADRAGEAFDGGWGSVHDNVAPRLCLSDEAWLENDGEGNVVLTDLGRFEAPHSRLIKGFSFPESSTRDEMMREMFRRGIVDTVLELDTLRVAGGDE